MYETPASETAGGRNELDVPYVPLSIRTLSQ
jgi:hypothetical protein